MSIIKTLRWINNHELSPGFLTGIIRYFYYNLRIRLQNSFTSRYLDHLKIYNKKGLSAAPGIFYVGVPDFEELLFSLHFLRSTDLFLDVGANIGTYSIPIKALTDADVHSFEPDSEMLHWFEKNINLNELTNVNIYRHAVGKSIEKLGFTEGKGELNRILEKGKGVEVDVKTLDSIFSKASLIKVDVEGYELMVLEGALDLLQNTDALIIEINGLCRKFGYYEEDILNFIKLQGFSMIKYDPIERKITSGEYTDLKRNFIFIRDLDFAKERVINSEPIDIKRNYAF